MKPSALWIGLATTFFLLFNRSESFGLNDALDVIIHGKDVVFSLLKTWDIISDYEDFNNKILPLETKEKRLLNKLKVVTQHLQEMAMKYDAVGTQTMSVLLRNLPERIRLELKLNDLRDYITRIDVSYRRMNNYVNTSDVIETHTLEDFAKSVISHDSSSVVNLLERIYTFLVPMGTASTTLDMGLLHSLMTVSQDVEGDMICNSKQSPQQVLLNLYNTIALTELKGYSMIQFSYMLLRVYKRGNFTKESELVRKRYEERTRESIKVMQKAMESSSRDLWKCDPKKHIKGQTYEEVTELLQGYLQNEVDLNPTGTCGESCSEYSYTKNYDCFKDLYCSQQRRCEGKIVNCRFYDSDMDVCPSRGGTSRRYDYIEYEDGKILGKKQRCSRSVEKVDSWWRWLFWHCSYCMCLCDDAGRNSDRYFNLRKTTSDVKNNKVVTGLRFRKANRIIHLQIQEGKLLPRGQIDPKSVQWVPIDEYKLTDRNVFNKHDYHMLQYESRALDLDDLIVGEGELVTGVRFKLLGRHLNFEIQVTPFNFATGQLTEPEIRSYWKDNANTDGAYSNPRTELLLINSDIPTKSSSPSIPDSKTDQYLEFVNTGFDQDVAQTTVPFIDIQSVESVLPVPLAGAGIYHKGRKNFGGFVAPKLITYDFGKHLISPFPEEEYEIGHTKGYDEDLVEIVPSN